MTHRYLKHIRKEWRKEILDYLYILPLNLDVEVNGIKYKLIHASPIEYYQPMASHYSSPKGFCVWKRWKPCYGVPDGCTLIFGHTPTIAFLPEGAKAEVYFTESFINIDCGAVFPDAGGRLACLRLEDRKVFYV